MCDISLLLNVAQRSVVPPWETPSWFKLFRRVDSDGGGFACRVPTAGAEARSADGP